METLYVNRVAFTKSLISDSKGSTQTGVSLHVGRILLVISLLWLKFFIYLPSEQNQHLQINIQSFKRVVKSFFGV